MVLILDANLEIGAQVRNYTYLIDIYKAFAYIESSPDKAYFLACMLNNLTIATI